MTEKASPASPAGRGSRARARTERPPRCERPKVENGKPCKRAAGAGTTHAGLGPCSLHDDGSWLMPPFAENAAVREAFLEALRADRYAGLRDLIEPLGYHRRDVTALLEADSEFEADYIEARGYDNDSLRTELTRRAIDGSDRLLEFEAKMRLPEARELQRHRFDGRIEVQPVPMIDASRGTLEELQQLRDLLAKFSPSRDEVGQGQAPALDLLQGGEEG